MDPADAVGAGALVQPIPSRPAHTEEGRLLAALGRMQAGLRQRRDEAALHLGGAGRQQGSEKCVAAHRSS